MRASESGRVRVLHIITGLSVGGAETMLTRLLQRMDRQRYESRVLSLGSLGEMGPRIAAMGIPVQALGMRAGAPNPVHLLRLWRDIRSWRPTIVHTWLYHADLLGGLAARLAGVRIVVWGIRHANLEPGANKAGTLLVARLCARLSSWLPSRILLNSEVARSAHVAFGYDASRMQVLPNGFDLSAFRPDPDAHLWLRGSLDLAATVPLVGLIGRFDVQKNHLGFLDAARRVLDAVPDASFVLVGRGVDAGNAALVDKARAVGVLSRCHFLGPRTDVPRIMAGLDVLASASIGEAFPNVVGEAMACEVPCAVTDVGDSAFVVGDTGRVVRSGDMAGLADALCALLRLPPAERQALGQRARQRVGEVFNIDQVTGRFDAVYQALLSEEASR